MQTGSFTATGTSSVLPITKADLSISGTFSATILLQRYMGDSWHTVETITAPIELVIEPANKTNFRLNCSAYTSGSVNYVWG